MSETIMWLYIPTIGLISALGICVCLVGNMLARNDHERARWTAVGCTCGLGFIAAMIATGLSG